MQKSKKFIIEDKQGNNMYPATFADVVYTEDGGNVAEKLKQIEGATPNAHTHTKSQITDFAHTHTKSEISDFPTSLPANGGNADTVDGKHASDFVSTSGVQLIDLDGNANVRFVGSNGTAYIQAGNSKNKGDMVLGGYMGVNLTSFDIMSDDKPTINKNPIYHTGNKPTKADVGLGSVNNWDATSAVNDASTTKYATASAVKQAYDKALQAVGKTWVPSNNVRHTVTITPKSYGNNTGYYQNAFSLGRVYVPPKARVRVKVSAYTVTQGSTSGRNFYAQVELGAFVGGGASWNIPQGSETNARDFANHVELRVFPYTKGVVGTNASVVTNAQQIDMDLNYFGSYYSDKSISFDGGWATYGVAVYTSYIHSCTAIKVDICYDEVSL